MRFKHYLTWLLLIPVFSFYKIWWITFVRHLHQGDLVKSNCMLAETCMLWSIGWWRYRSWFPFELLGLGKSHICLSLNLRFICLKDTGREREKARGLSPTGSFSRWLQQLEPGMVKLELQNQSGTAIQMVRTQLHQPSLLHSRCTLAGRWTVNGTGSPAWVL